MLTYVALCLLVPATNVPSAESTKTANSSVSHPPFVDAPRNLNRLTLYNDNGEVVARCERRDEAFHECKMEPRVTLDDLMNAWVHAYLDVQK